MKYNLVWYVGSVKKIKEVIEIKTVEAKNINSVKITSILPNELIDNIRYIRMLEFEKDKRVVVDYGSWSRFIEIKAIN